MIPFAKISKLTGVVLAAMALSAPAADTPKHVDVKQLSKKVENVVVPLPNEVFGALNKLGGVKIDVAANAGQNLATTLGGPEFQRR